MDELLKNCRQALFLGYLKMFRRYTWQWFCTLTVKYEYDNMMKLCDMVIDWIRKLQKTEHIQVACIYIICEKCQHQHIHLLMSGRGNYKGEIKTLSNVNRRKWEKQWPSFARIKLVKSQDNRPRYLALHTLKKRCDDYRLEFYNLKLLKKMDTQSLSK